MKLKLVRDQDTELKIENLLSTKGFEDTSNSNVLMAKQKWIVNEDSFQERRCS